MNGELRGCKAKALSNLLTGSINQKVLSLTSYPLARQAVCVVSEAGKRGYHEPSKPVTDSDIWKCPHYIAANGPPMHTGSHSGNLPSPKTHIQTYILSTPPSKFLLSLVLCRRSHSYCPPTVFLRFLHWPLVSLPPVPLIPAALVANARTSGPDAC